MFNLDSVYDVGSSRTDIQADTPPLANLGRSVKKRMSWESIDPGLRLLGYIQGADQILNIRDTMAKHIVLNAINDLSGYRWINEIISADFYDHWRAFWPRSKANRPANGLANFAGGEGSHYWHGGNCFGNGCN